MSSNERERCVEFGKAYDAGYAFEIAVLALDKPKQRRVARRFDESCRSGRWDAIARGNELSLETCSSSEWRS